jgi:hypothetical protein
MDPTRAEDHAGRDKVYHIQKKRALSRASQQKAPVDVAEGSLADTSTFQLDVRFAPESGH